MRFMIIGRATKEPEAGILPKPEAITKTKELIAGFTIIQAKSLDEAIEWVKRAPNLAPDGEALVEIRKVMDIEDFGDEFTPNPGIAKVKIQ